MSEATSAKAPRSKRRTWIAVTAALCIGIGVGIGGTQLWRLADPEEEYVRVSGYSVQQNSFGGYDITLSVLGAVQTTTRWDVHAYSDRVVVTVYERHISGPTLMMGQVYSLTWPLGAPLGSRPVIDGSTGRVVPSSQ
jgi:hypothetical protein